jgi:hypothetical protein
MSATTGPSAATSSPPPSASPSASGLAHATGAHDLLLRSATRGGLVAPGQLLAARPEFSLYGDGTVLYLPLSTGGGGAPDLRRASVAPAELDRLLSAALDEGHLRTAKSSYDASGVADAPTTVFTIHAGGVDKMVSVYALGIASPAPEQAGDRAAFQTLADRLADFKAEIDAGRAKDDGPYEPTAYRAYLLPGEMRENLDWPWKDFGPDDFKVADDTGQPSRLLTPAEASKLVRQPENGTQVEVVGPDRAPYQVILTAVLPDDAT